MSVSLSALQRQFTAGLFDRDQTTIADQVCAQGELSAAQRFGIYRNSAHGLLWEHLRAVYPVCTQLLGERVFEGFVRAWIDQHPPTTPYLADYGDTLPEAIRTEAAFADVVWVADVARLEWARQHAWHSPNQAASDLAALAMLDEAQQAAVTFALSPSASLVQSPWAIYAIWAAHQADSTLSLAAIDLQQATQLIILRQGRSLLQQPLTSLQYDFLHAIADHASLGTLVGQFTNDTPTLLQSSLRDQWIVLD